MGTGYTRADTLNNIADGNIINASDIDSEYDAIEAAFNESTGHTHDGTAAEGAPITVLGPVQDFIASATEIKPKTTNTLDIGTNSLQFKDMYLDGAAYIGNISVDGNTISSTDTNGDITLDPNGTGVVDVTGTVTADGLTVDTSDQVIINHSADGGGIRIDSTNGTNTGSLRFGDVADNYIGAVEYNHSTDALSFYANNATRMTITSGGSVGIGTSSPSAKAHIQTASSGSSVASSGDELFVEGSGDAGITVGAGNTSKASLFFADDGDSAAGRIRYDHSDNSMQFGTSGQAERMRIDGSGNVGIGTSSPTASVPLTIVSDSGNAIAQNIRGRSDGIGVLLFSDNSDVENGRIDFRTNYAEIKQTRNAPLVFSTNNTERMRIDSSGFVGIGTTSMVRTFEVTDGTSGKIRAKGTDGGFIECHNGTNGVYFGTAPAVLGSGSGGDSVIYTDSGFNQLYYTNGAERMRIDSGGNLLVGTTSATFSGSGRGLIELNGSTESLLALKHGDTAGLYLYTSNVEGRVAQFANLPMTFFTNNTERMRILSTGGITFNGDTAAANALNDYEEGTWTPVFQASVTNPTIASQGNSTGRYVKIGNIVHFWFYDSGTNITNAGSGYASVGGLPYNNESSYYPVFQYIHGTSFANGSSGGYVSSGTNSCIFIQRDTISTVLWATGTTYMMISGTYKTA